MDDDQPIARGILFILGVPSEDDEPSLEGLRFDKKIFELESQGLCTIPPIKWIN